MTTPAQAQPPKQTEMPPKKPSRHNSWKIKPGFKKNRLTLIERLIDNRGRTTKGIFLCECGVKKHIIISSVSSGHAKSCGCYHREMPNSKSRTHGYAGSLTWIRWCCMRDRINNKNLPAYKNYGGRGITFAKRWELFENFLADMGECPPGYSLERVDVNGNYEPKNCTWIPKNHQGYNQQNTVYLTYNGEKKRIVDWEKETGLSKSTMYGRYKMGWSTEDILFKPYKYRHPLKAKAKAEKEKL